VTSRAFDVLAFEGFIGRLLLIGLRTSEVCLLAGLTLWLIDPNGARDSWLLRVGLIALMCVPGLRIGLTVVEALRMKDGWFAATTAAVALVLGVSIAYAFLIT
jgi:hypothetical protein